MRKIEQDCFDVYFIAFLPARGQTTRDQPLLSVVDSILWLTCRSVRRSHLLHIAVRSPGNQK